VEGLADALTFTEENLNPSL
jgi:hypothetical protein